MIVEQRKYSAALGWQTVREAKQPLAAYNLVIAFGCRALLSDPAFYSVIREMYPSADIVMNSTAGEITGDEVNDNTISLTAIHFEKTEKRCVMVDIEHAKNSYDAGRKLANELNKEGLINVLVFSDGHSVNGSDLVQGLSDSLSEETILTGGLAGDGADFKLTLVGLNEAPSEGKIVAIGFYGSSLQVNYGSMGGWDPFGPFRLITGSEGNVLYELDGKPALDTYKMYLGEFASELPGSALHFPLSIRTNDSDNTIVRTILSVNEEDKSLTFAGNMPKGAYAQLMKANFDRLVDGASHAATHSVEGDSTTPDVAILISCVGRKLVLGQRIEEEVEAVRNIYGDHTVITGFYSYGEIAPSFNFLKCDLHNQTMTITTLKEL